MNRRLLTTTSVLLAILFLPYWIYLPLLLATIIFFPFFWEGILLAFLVDVLFGLGIESVSGLISSYAFMALLLVVVLMPLRERIRINA